MKENEAKNAEARNLFQTAKARFEGQDSGYSRNIWGINASLAQVEAALGS